MNNKYLEYLKTIEEYAIYLNCFVERQKNPDAIVMNPYTLNEFIAYKGENFPNWDVDYE